MSEVERGPLARGAGALLRGWRSDERDDEGGGWLPLGPHTLPLAAGSAILSTATLDPPDMLTATDVLPVAPNPLAALFDDHSLLTTWPTGETPVGIPFGGPVRVSSARRASYTPPAPPRTEGETLSGETNPSRFSSPTGALGSVDRPVPSPSRSAQPAPTPREPPAPAPEGRLSAAEAAQRLLAAGGRPTLALTARRDPAPQEPGSRTEGSGPLPEGRLSVVALPSDIQPVGPATPDRSGWVDPGTQRPGEARPAAQPPMNTAPEYSRTRNASPTSASAAPERRTSSVRPLRSPGAATAAIRASGAASTVPVPAGSPARPTAPGGSSGSSGVVWPGDPSVDGDVESVPGSSPAFEVGAAGSVAGGAAEARRANIARVLKADGGRATVAVTGVSAPAASPAPTPVPAGSPARPTAPGVPVPAGSPARPTAPGGSSGSSGVVWPGDPSVDEGLVGTRREPSNPVDRTQRESTDSPATRYQPVSSITAIQPNSVRRVPGETPITVEPSPAAERPASRTADLDGTTGGANTAGEPVPAKPMPPPASRPLQRSTGTGSALNPNMRRVSEHGLGIGLDLIARLDPSSPETNAERMNPASRPSRTVTEGVASFKSAPTPLRSAVVESAALRSVRREQPGVLGRQTPVVDRSAGSRPSSNSPDLSSFTATSQAPGSVPGSASSDSDAVTADGLVARLQGRTPRLDRAQRETPPVRASTPQRSATSNQRTASVPAVRKPSVTTPSTSSSSADASMRSETIRRSPDESGSDFGSIDQPSNDIDIDALADEIERRLQRRLRLGFDRRGGFRGGGRSWPR